MKDKLIVADSCCDLSCELKEKLDVEIVPSTLQLDDVDYLDDENLNVKDYIEKIIKKDDLVLTTGCGNPDLLARMIVEG